MLYLRVLIQQGSHFEDFSGSAREQQEEVLRGRMIWANIVYAYES